MSVSKKDDRFGTLPDVPVTRRTFVRVVSMAAAATATGAVPLVGRGETKPVAESAKSGESLVKTLYDTLTEAQKQEICFTWDYTDDRGLLRTHVSNNWHVTPEQFNVANGEFFTKDQQALIKDIYFSLYNPEWHERVQKQLNDDAPGGWGRHQTIALFGEPGSGKFQFLMTGRHLTIRCDGDSADHVAFGGPIFYGHAASGFNEKAGHPGNVFWTQAQKANGLFKMLDGKQREQALVLKAPGESQVAFKGNDGIAGLPIGELSADQKGHAQEVLKALVEPFRTSDREEAVKLLNAQGGLDACRLAFYRQDGRGNSLDLGDDGEWDVWRLEGPSFVWHFRGVPHVHVWVNIADDPSLPLNAKG